MLIMAALGGAACCSDRWSVRRSWCRWRKSPTTCSRQGRGPDLRRVWRHHRADRRFQPGGILTLITGYGLETQGAGDQRSQWKQPMLLKPPM